MFRPLYKSLITLDFVNYSYITCIFCETYGQCRSENFLFKQIFLVEEENDGGVTKPFVVAD